MGNYSYKWHTLIYAIVSVSTLQWINTSYLGIAQQEKKLSELSAKMGLLCLDIKPSHGDIRTISLSFKLSFETSTLTWN